MAMGLRMTRKDERKGRGGMDLEVGSEKEIKGKNHDFKRGYNSCGKLKI